MAGGIEFDMEPRRFLIDSVGGLSVQYKDAAALAKMALRRQDARSMLFCGRHTQRQRGPWHRSGATLDLV